MRFRRPRSWFVAFVSTALVSLLVLTACGSDEEEATAAPAQPTARPAATSAPAATATPASTPTPAATPTPRGPAGTLDIALDTLGPENFVTRVTSGQEIALTHMVADPLFSLNPATRALEGRLISEWSYQKNGTDNVWSFKVRPGAVINEGNGTWSSEDVRFNFAEFLKTDSRNSLTSGMRLLIDTNISNFAIVSPTEFKVHSTKFDAASIRSISVGTGFAAWQPSAYSQRVGDTGYSAHPVGTASYIFKSGVKGSKYTLEAVPNHWRKTASIQTVNVLLVPEAATRLAMLKTGQADLATMEKRFKGELTGNLRSHAIPKQALAFVALGGQYYDTPDKLCTTCPWVGYTANAIKVREALTIAIDRTTIISKLLSGEGTLASAPFNWMPGNQAHVDSSWPIPEYNPTRAKQLLTEAGFPTGFPIQFAFVVSATFPEGLDVAEGVAGYWEAIGIKVSRMPMDFTTQFRVKMADRTTGGFAWILANTIKDDPLPDMRNLFSKSGAIASLHDPEIDKYIIAASAEPDDAKRAALGKTLGKYIIDTRIGLPLFGVNGVWGASAKVKSWDNILGFAFLNGVETITLS